jgi:hypothetical protein
MDALCSTRIATSWEKNGADFEHEAAASFSMPMFLPQVSRKRPRIESTGDWAEDAPNDISDRAQPQFPRKKTRLRTAKAPPLEGQDIHTPAGTSVQVRSNVPSKDSREHSTQEWESHKDKLEQLYKVQGKRSRK